MAGQISKKLAEEHVPRVAIQVEDLSRFQPHVQSPKSNPSASWLLWRFVADAPSEIIILYDESLFRKDTLTRNKLCLHELGHMVLHTDILLHAAMKAGSKVYAVANSVHEMEAWWFSYCTLASCAANIAFDARADGSLDDTVYSRRFL